MNNAAGSGNLAIVSATGAAFAAFIPLSALLILSPSDYGRFSVVYLIYAFSVSLQLSLLSDPWARARVQGSHLVSWGEFSTAQMWLSATTLLATFICALLLNFPVFIALGMAIGSAGTLRHFAARYYYLATKTYGRPLTADILGILAGILALSLFFYDVNRVTVVALVWLSLGVLGAVPFGASFLGRGHGLKSWVGSHKNTIKPLLADSLIMDASAIGVPMLLAGFFSAAQFGTYRAVSNVAMPVRIALGPLRASLSNWSLAFWRGGKGVLVAFLPAVIFGLLCYLALILTGEHVSTLFPTLAGLLPFALPTALFVGANFVGQLYYMVSRIHNRAHTVLRCRLIQTILTVIGPLAGMIIGGLPGAIWGFSISYLSSALVWGVPIFNRRAT